MLVYPNRITNMLLIFENTSIDGNTELCKKVDFCEASNKKGTKNIVPILAGVSASVIFVVGLVVISVWRVQSRKQRTVRSAGRGMTNSNLFLK